MIGLASCGGSGNGTPAVSATGTWDGTFSVNDTAFNTIQMVVSQTDTPNAGDFKGTLTSDQVTGNSPVVGNTKTGKITSTDASGAMACEGSFSQNLSRYDGTCNITNNVQVIQVQLQMAKR